jgi:D-alanyl-D-alanine carboxypeptidase
MRTNPHVQVRRGRPGKLIALVGLVAVVAGCGDSSDQPSADDRSAPTTVTTDPASPAASSTIRSDSGTTPAESTPFGALPTEQLDDETVEELQVIVDRASETGNPAAIAAVVTSEGVWSGAAGVDGPDGRLASPRDQFAIASISKMFTAALVLRLVDQGKIDLDKPLSDYLGALNADANGSTVRQALAMQSGIPDTAPESIAKVVASPEHIWTTEEVVAEFPTPVAPPGAEFNYSNPSYKMLDFAAEHVVDAPLSQAMRSEVVEPAGLTTAPLVQSGDASTPEPWALPITSGDLDVTSYGTGGALPSVADATFSLGAAGMASDAPSLAAWAWQLFAGKIVSAESLLTMTTIGADGYGLGVEDLTGPFGMATVVGHGGSKDGYQSILAVIPDRHTVIVVFVNQRDANVASLAASLLDALEA